MKEASARAAEVAVQQESARQLLTQELEAERAESASSREAARRAAEALAAKEAEWKQELSAALADVAEKYEQESLLKEAMFKYKMEALESLIMIEKDAVSEAERRVRESADMAAALGEVAAKVEREAASTQALLQTEAVAAAAVQAQVAAAGPFGASSGCAVEFVVGNTPEGAAGVALVGNAQALGAWDAARGVRMQRGAGGEWRCVVMLASARVYLYRYVLTDGEGRPLEEARQQRQDSALSIRAAEDALQVQDDWEAPQTGAVLSAAGLELRQDRLASLLTELVAEQIPPGPSSIDRAR